MNRPIIVIHDIEKDERIEREMNDSEFAQYQKDVIADEKLQAELESKKNAKNVLLEKLGLTEEEAKLLLS